MEKTVAEHLIKISMAQTPTDKPMRLGDEVRVVVSGDVVKIEQKDNQDGTYNQVYVIKGIVAEMI